MPITIPSMVLNAAVGFATWMSDITPTAKIAISLILIGKYVLFFFSVWMADSIKLKKFAVIACMLFNAALIVYGCVCEAYYIVTTVAVTLVILVAWSFSVVFDFSFMSRKDK